MCALLGLMRVFAMGWAGKVRVGAMMNGCGWVDGLGWGVDCEWEWVGWGISGVGTV